MKLPINPNDYVQLNGDDDIPAELLDRDNKPAKNLPGMEPHQLWIWMNGPGKPHWEIRGTGVIF